MAGKPNDKVFKTMAEIGGEDAARNYYREHRTRRGGSVTGVKKGFAAIRTSKTSR